jgi:hypothetical protein
MDSTKIECMCIGCGITHQLVQEEITLESIDDGEFKVVTNCSCTVCGEALIAATHTVEDEPPEIYG